MPISIPKRRRFLPLISVMNFRSNFCCARLLPPVLAVFAGSRSSDFKFERKLAFWGYFGICVALVVLATSIVWFAHGYPVAGEAWPVTFRSGSSRAIFLILEGGTFCALCRARTARLRHWLSLTFLLVLCFDLFTHCPNQNPTVIRSIYGPEIRPARQLNPKPKLGESRF
jgi:hypothetical protein